jgi:hypothetical protein
VRQAGWDKQDETGRVGQASRMGHQWTESGLDKHPLEIQPDGRQHPIEVNLKKKQKKQQIRTHWGARAIGIRLAKIST